MQADEHNYQPDEQFTDHGWSEMLKTLDQEMPVEKKKRRGFFWLLPLLLIGGIASVWAIYFMDKNSKSGLVSNEQITTYSTPDIKNEEEVKNEKELSGIPTKANSKENTVIQTSSNIIDTNGRYPLNEQNLSNSTVKTLKPIVLEEDRQEETEVISNELIPVNNRIIEELITIDPVNITLKLRTLERMNIVDPKFYFEGKEIVEPVDKSFKEKLEFGVFAGVVSDFSQITKIGGTTGFTVDFPFSNKFGLRTGLGYTQLRKEQPYVFIGNQEANLSSDFVDVSTAAPPFETVAVQSRAYFVLENLHHLDLPVLFTYSPSKKIQFQLGGNLSYLLKAQTQLTTNNLSINNAVNDDYAVFGIELSDLDNNTLSQNQYQEEEYWTQLNINAVAGVVWRPFKKWSLGLQYHHGFLPILKSESNGNNTTPELVGGGGFGVRGFEVYDNSGGFNAGVNTPLGNLESSFQRDRFIRYNHSIRVSVGYNF